jgi:hypothetical protein
MGFVSNQWLNRGRGIRKRSYQPVPVSIACDWASDRWSRDHEVVIEFTARRSNLEFQTLHLSLAEVDRASLELAGCISSRGRARLLAKLLGGLSDSELLKTLSPDLSRRVREAEKA